MTEKFSKNYDFSEPFVIFAVCINRKGNETVLMQT